MINPLVYVPTPMPEGGTFKISPSAFSRFIEKPHIWYRDAVLKENPFSYNTSTVIGTIVHYCAEMVAQGEVVDQIMIDEYIDSFDESEDYSADVVRQNYQMMAECLVNFYVLENEYLEIESQHIIEIADGYYVGGALDRLEGIKSDCMVVDYKTYNSKATPKVIPSYYKQQLLVYAAILRKKGYNPTRIRLVYINRNIDGGTSEKTGKPLKSYPPTVTVLTENINGDDFHFINGLLQLCVDSLKAVKKYPELTHVIFHDPRLKVETKN